MKIYTEEQVRMAIELARDTHTEGRAYMERDEYDYSEDEVINLLTPIELPSDEDINIQSYIHNPIKKIDGKLSAVSFIEGAKWVIEQIKQQCK